jgi:hypothetical protein
MKVYGVKQTSYSGGVMNQTFANQGMVTHLAVVIEASAATGGTTNMLSSCRLHVSLNGRDGGKIIDGLTLSELASICDQDGGAVTFDQPASATAGFKCRMSVPLGAFRLDDGDSLDCELSWPAPTTFTSFKAELGVHDDGTRVETGIYRYQRSSLVFGAANSSIDRNLVDPDLVKAWLFDEAAVWEACTVTVPEGHEGGGTGPREIWEVATFMNSEASSVVEGSSLWNSAIVVYSEDVVTAHGSGCTVVATNGAVTGTVTLLTLANKVNQKRVSNSTLKNVEKTERDISRIERSDPQKAKAFRHLGLTEKAAVAQKRTAVIRAATPSKGV